MAVVKVSRRQVSTWLDDVMNWQKLDGLEQLQEINSSLDLEDLSQFLKNLEFTLSSMISVSEALEQLPNVGQLLGRICALPTIASHPTVYIHLAKCILWFAVENPCTHVEQRAKSWALALLRSTVRLKSATSQVSLYTGHTQKVVNSFIAHEIEASLASELQPTRRWCTTLQCYVPVLAGDAQPNYAEKLLNIISYCLQNYHVQAYKNCLDIMVRHLGTSPDSNIIEMASERLATYQQEFLCGKQEIGLSCDAARFLWCTRLESLEDKVLYLLEQCCSAGDFHFDRFQQLVKESHLAKILTEESGVYLVVIKMLESILPTTQHEAVSQALRNIIKTPYT